MLLLPAKKLRSVNWGAVFLWIKKASPVLQSVACKNPGLIDFLLFHESVATNPESFRINLTQ